MSPPTTQALILAGGEGTRLRPLTTRIAKPVVTLVDRPFIAYMLEWLRRHGVTDVVLSCGFLAAGVRAELGDGARHGVTLHYVEEPEPLGTAGALLHAADLLGERFLVCNGDILTDIDLGAQFAQHERTGARATLALIEVEDASAYGLVRCEADGAVREFLEKPQGPAVGPQLVSAGAYVLERDVLELIPRGRAASLEREVWPALIGHGLYGHHARGYWMDIGTPARYLQGTFDIITGAVATDGDAGTSGGTVIGPGAVIDPSARIGPLVVLGEGVHVGADTSIERSVVLAGARIGAGCVLRDCIVAERAKIGDDAELEGDVVIGEDAEVQDRRLVAAGARVDPGARV
jgi:mannose-1-phosphate guanylyltransferase